MRLRLRLFVTCVAVIVFVGTWNPVGYTQTKPVVVSTDPPNGATSVSRSLTWVSFTFSKPMRPRRGGTSSYWHIDGGKCGGRKTRRLCA
jgi:Bacterial Ig-like domain